MARTHQRSRTRPRKQREEKAVSYLRFHRFRLGLTQIKMARRISISQAYYCELENGDKRPDPEVCARISDVIGRPPEEVVSKLHHVDLARMGMAVVGTR